MQPANRGVWLIDMCEADPVGSKKVQYEPKVWEEMMLQFLEVGNAIAGNRERFSLLVQIHHTLPSSLSEA